MLKPYLAVIFVTTAACAARPIVVDASVPASQRDSDRDGIVDAADRCPTKPETVNAHNDTDGCPDKLRARWNLVAPGIVLAATGIPLLTYGAVMTRVALEPGQVDPGMTNGFEKVGIPLLVIGTLHELLGINLILGGAT